MRRIVSSSGGRDVQGRLLSDRGALSLGDLVVLHPSLPGSLFDLITFVDPAREVFVSGASEEKFQIRAFERAFDPEQRTSWTVSYQPVKGIEADVHLVIETGDWIELPLRLAIPDKLNSILRRGSSLRSGSHAGPKLWPAKPHR